MAYLIANPRRHARRRHNPVFVANPHRRRRNPEVLGMDMGDAAYTAAGAIGSAYVNSIVVTPFLGGVLSSLGQFRAAAEAVASAVGFHWVARKLSPGFARRASGGTALYAGLGIADAVAPGVIPISIGVPKPLAQFNPLAALKPAAQAPANGQASAPAQLVRIRTANGL